MDNLPECCYRISVKALVLNETKDKFLICQEDNGHWELPGGGLDWGATPQDDIAREIDEEMGLATVSIADHPSYFVTFDIDNKTKHPNWWRANVVYETVLENLDFTPSDECIAVKFVNKDDLEGLEVFSNVQQLAEQFDKNRHI